MALPPGMRPVKNPPNPWLSTEVEYLEELGEPPIARLEIIEDATKSILSENDSPDLGFRWSVNPYRGCWHACAFCLDGDTPILRGDGTHAPLRAFRVGDEIYGTEQRGSYRRYVKTRVLDVWQTIKAAFRVELSDGSSVIASGGHRFLTRRGWKYVTGSEQGRDRRPHLTTNDVVMGTGGFQQQLLASHAYKKGYLTGMVRGDGLLRSYSYPREGRSHGDQFQFRLALVDFEPLLRVRAYLAEIDVQVHDVAFYAGTANHKPLRAIRTHARQSFEKIRTVVDWPDEPDDEWRRGFLGGIFDAEGSWSQGVLRISNNDERILGVTQDALARFGFDAVLEPPTQSHAGSNVRIRGGLREHLRFMHLTDPCITRKRDFAGRALKTDAAIGVKRVVALGYDLLMYDITTGTGDFIANGVVSHNCYARPRHELLSFGAGTDFERKLVVKPSAPALLREAFDKPSWKGELLMLSGDTDCYQPLEASYRLTRGILEACVEYKNPCAVISKAPLVERDIDLFVELTRVADFGITISIPLWNPEHSRAIEPFVATPKRRIKTIERLAAAGLRVSVNIAPMIPGLGDEDMPAILEAARDAGATRAGFTFLRLPGPVAGIFEDRLRERVPLRADRVLSRVRAARGGKLYDPRFGARMRGQGPYAEAAVALFEATTKRLGFETSGGGPPAPRRDTFQRPDRSLQLKLF
jgi:DNA repair photolyase